MIQIFWGPFEVFIKNNIRVDQYAKNTTCPVIVIGSDSDRTLSDDLQRKLSKLYSDSECKIFSGVEHEDYYKTDSVVSYIKEVIS